MNLNLKGKTALVCGSSMGIGWAAAQELASYGANLVLMARNEEKLIQRLQELPKSESQIHRYLVADFSQAAQLQSVIAAFCAANEVHILVNNTGGPAGGPIFEAKTEEFLSAFNNHLICNHILVQHVAPGMIKSGYGRIINVISTSVKQPLPNLGVSNTIRAAVANWSKTLANELGVHGITVNNVLPGATDTQRLSSIIEAKSEKTGKKTEDIRASMAAEVPLKRVARPEEIAAAIVFLASPAASYINGINLPVDGGRTSSL
jgi:3-oxoacyl-[acyl-carrier protein] reductase